MPAPDAPSGLTMTEADGQQYYIIGKTRIKIVEYFSQNGKPIDELIANLVQQKIREIA